MKKRSAKVDLTGIILLDKPFGLSSNNALQKVRYRLNAQKAGHTGSLDPYATGLLPICLGRATRLCEMMLGLPKTYDVDIKLGVETDSGDAEGAVIAEQPVAVTPQQIEPVLDQFRGAIKQVPPMYSALKKDGQPLYKLARKGITVERPARDVTVYALTLLDFNGDRLSLSVRCSSGFYVRSLAVDIGRVFGCGAHVSALRRTSIGDLTINQCVTLDDFDALSMDQRLKKVYPSDIGIGHLPALQLDNHAAADFRHGRLISDTHTLIPDTHKLSMDTWLRIYDAEQVFLGLAALDSDGALAPKRVLKPANQ